MSRARIRQIARLQRAAQPYLKQKEQDDRKWQQTIRGAANHAAVLAFVYRYGQPQIDEPLSDAVSGALSQLLGRSAVTNSNRS